MRVQHNIVSMNAYRNYNNNTRQINRNIEKLSSGYKINRAGDDAAGLAISEKMRAQITGLEGAQKNAKDGISLVQTAEGALTEVHSMLNRMYSLAEQSANGTYDENTDRAQLQKEVSSLRTEINRIADSANFNGLKLLDGSMSRASVDLSDDELNSFVGISLLAEDKQDMQKFLDTLDSDFSVTLSSGAKETFKGHSLSFDGIDELLNAGYKVTVTDSNGKDLSKEIATGSTKVWTVNSDNEGTLKFADDSSAAFAHDGNHHVNFKVTTSDGKDVANISYRVDLDASKISGANGETAAIESTITLKDNDGLNLQIGDDANSWNIMNVSVSDIHASALGIANVDISEQGSAQAAMNAIKDAINYVSDVRGGLGATQNRLDHTINNLSVMQENIQDAESTIRDTDVADEMMRYTKNSILVQSAQAMLAQANQQPQGVLQLLQ
jgi:flagellin